MIPRPKPLRELERAITSSPVTALLGPRQCGKTTLARALAATTPSTFFDLEDPVDRARLSAPRQALSELRDLVVLDEIQRAPELIEILRVLADRPDTPARFLVLGSASPDLVRGTSETLAGRVRFVDLGGLSLEEVGTDALLRRWVRGGYPRAFLAEDEETSVKWREDFVRTFLERDLGRLGINVPAETMRRLWTMIAHYHGQIWNGAELARALGTGETTVRRHLDLLDGTYMVRVLQPWHENLSKRQVRAPKVYLRDTGLLHTLLRLEDLDQLRGHPKVGASWEGFALEEVLAVTNTREAYFWATHGGAELDLMILARGRRYGIEFKYSDAPRRTRSMLAALEDLGLQRMFVVYPGTASYSVHEKIDVLPLTGFATTWEDFTS